MQGQEPGNAGPVFSIGIPKFSRKLDLLFCCDPPIEEGERGKNNEVGSGSIKNDEQAQGNQIIAYIERVSYTGMGAVGSKPRSSRADCPCP